MIDDLDGFDALDDFGLDPDVSPDLDDTAGEDIETETTIDVADPETATLTLDLPDPFDSATDTGLFELYDGTVVYEYQPVWELEDFDGIGDPAAAAEFWVHQELRTSCAIAAQGSVIHAMTGVEIPEADLVEIAVANDWFDPVRGTSTEKLDALLVHHGIESERVIDASIFQVADALEAGDHVLVGITGEQIWTPLRDAETGFAVPLPPGGPGHIVEVTGIDEAADGTFYVIVNDPGHPEGAAFPVALEDFIEAWDQRDNLLIVAHRGG